MVVSIPLERCVACADASCAKDGDANVPTRARAATERAAVDRVRCNTMGLSEVGGIVRLNTLLRAVGAR